MDLKVTPEELASLSGVPNPINFSKLPRNDPTYGNVEAYTMRFADRHSGKTLFEKLKKLFDDKKPYAAFAVAINTRHH
ncbi:hypothetical protein C6341_g24115 [Phytophthora cactorum]|nr:hypothetical protein C6341_g24115 [Phytophthora cactorum]